MTDNLKKTLNYSLTEICKSNALPSFNFKVKKQSLWSLLLFTSKKVLNLPEMVLICLHIKQKQQTLQTLSVFDSK